MADYEHETRVEAPVNDLFDYLADVRHLPQYFEEMTKAEPGDGDEVHVTAQVHGETQEGSAWFHVDRDQLRLTWGSEGPNGYHGELSVADDADGSRVRVSLHTEAVQTAEIDDSLSTTMDDIKRLAEEQLTGR